tara:strand:- start:1040 stop:1351 length:312 start_codon:yes stop_codon:yes gene_type:complete
MTVKHYNKLVRDRIPEVIEETGKTFSYRTATQTEYKNALLDKLLEEVIEFREDPSPQELGDILEVIDALKKEYKLMSSFADQIAKRVTLGAFDKKIILEWVEE